MALGEDLDREWDNASWLPSGPVLSALPTKLPIIPGLLLDASHVAAASGGTSGRAWFDVLALPGGRAAMLVGDVAAQAIPEGAAAARVREVLADLVSANNDLEIVLDRMDHRLGAGAADPAASVCLALVDPVVSGAEYRTFGHPPAMIVAPEGTRYVQSSGTQQSGSRPVVPSAAGRLAPDEVLLLYTDGTDQREELALSAELTDLPSGTGAAADGPSGRERSFRTEAVCRAAAKLIRRTSSRPEMAVLAVQPRPAVPRFELTLSAAAASIEDAREAVVEWLSGLRSSVEDGAGMALAIGEAMANAFQHAFVGARAGSVVVEASLQSDGVLACFVRDDGRWRPRESAPGGSRGSGLDMMARVCDQMLVHRESKGTVIELRRRLHHPVLGSAQVDADQP